MLLIGDAHKHLQFVSIYIFNFIVSMYAVYVVATIKNRNDREKSVLYLLSLAAIISQLALLFTWVGDQAYLSIALDSLWIIFWYDIGKGLKPEE